MAALAVVAQLGWTLFLCARRLQVRLRSKGHVPGLWAWCGAGRRKPMDVYFHWDASLSHSLPFSLKTKSINCCKKNGYGWRKLKMCYFTLTNWKMDNNYKHGAMAIESNWVIKSKTWILKDNGMFTSFSAVLYNHEKF